ncbi:hypothetical protein TIFTF001_020979 [Ficus carica]|uniref:Uncharacterized protein n=1 Tax=Ficus carica TaxID=3494 RepID=A0AA88AGP6_FICCA|nr:hypothetical protein TIFTF001_020979 [Ficus carica]
MARPASAGARAAVVPSSATVTTTITLNNSEGSSSSSSPTQQPQTLTLRLSRKKKVTWKEGTVDNEFMQKKSSKKCCIFHKQKPFDEDDSDEENDNHHHHHHHDRGGDEGCCSKDNDHLKILDDFVLKIVPFLPPISFLLLSLVKLLRMWKHCLINFRYMHELKNLSSYTVLGFGILQKYVTSKNSDMEVQSACEDEHHLVAACPEPLNRD